MNFKIFYCFTISVLATIFLSALTPQVKPLFFAPCLVISFFNVSFASALWLAAAGGALVDLFSSTHIGLHALLYTLSAALLYRQKKYFKDSLVNIAIYTMLLSLTYTILNVLLLYVFEKGINLSFIWFITDLIGLSLLDGIYALIFFALPLKGYELLKKRRVIFEK